MKKLFSKRSGFTLVEILVAFVIFAIFATMIMEVLRLAIAQRSSNNEFSEELEKQEEIYAKTYKKVDYDDTNKSTEKLEFEFYNNDGSSALDFDLEYEVRDARGNKGSTAYEGINYFLSDVDYDKEGDNVPGGGDDTGKPGKNSGSQTSRTDTRITGTRDITKIKIHQVVKDTSTEGLQPGQVRYYFEVSADAGDPNIPNSGAMADEDVPYAQYRLYFHSTTELDADASAVVYQIKDDDGNVVDEYTKKVYQEAKVVDIGYVNSTSLSYNASSLVPTNKYDNKGTFNPYTVQKSGRNGVRIGTPFKDSGVRFDVSKFTRFYVVFDKDPGLTAASFGANGTDDGYGSYEYSAYPVYDDDGNDTGEDHVNIYGAYEYEKVYK